jgi:hypothetical protein
MATQIQLRRDTAANWTSTNPTMAQGEAGYETDTGKLKIGDGSTAWNSLAYQAAANIVDGTIVNADVNASAAIAGTKISPDFGSQNVVTTGSSSAASFAPTSTAGIGVGMRLHAANEIGFNTNSNLRLLIDSFGNVGINTVVPGALLHVEGTSKVTGAATFDSSATVTGLISANGKVSFPLGTAALPSLYPGTDTNTGIYSPGADQLAISTNGTGRLFVDASGRVIVGASSAVVGNPLEVVATSNGNAIAVRGRSSDNLGIITFHPNASSTEYARIQAESDSSLRFGTGSAGSERMRLDSSGRLGLGTSTFSYLANKLVIDKGSTANDGITIVSSPTSNASLWFADGTTGSQAFAGGIDYQHSTDELIFYRGGLGDMRLTSTGLGIGTTSPNESLEVAGNIHVSGADRSIFNRSNNALTFGTNNTERARIDSSGRLLIGTSSDSKVSRLVVQGHSSDSTAHGIVRIRRGATNPASGADIGSIVFEDSAGSAAAFIDCVSDGTWGSNDYPGRLTFSTTADGASSPTERMRIEESGRACFLTASSAGSTISSAHPASAGTSSAVFTGSHSATSILGGTVSIRIWNNGNVQNTNNSYGSLSDVKLKENIVAAGSQWNDLKALQVRKYNFKEGQTHTQIGLIAQEVELVSPGLVSESPDRDEDGNDLGTVTKSVNYSVLYMKAVKALQEAMERIETLEADVAALKAQ